MNPAQPLQLNINYSPDRLPAVCTFFYLLQHTSIKVFYKKITKAMQLNGASQQNFNKRYNAYFKNSTDTGWVFKFPG